MSSFSPLVVELPRELDSVTAFRRLAGREHCVFLDSARRSDELGRYSYIAADPFETVVGEEVGKQKPLSALSGRLRTFSAESIPDLPPFQGGAAGLWSYDLSRSLECIALTRHDEFALPTMLVGLYDVVLAFDHQREMGWLVSQGFPKTDPAQRTTRAKQRADTFLGWLECEETPLAISQSTLAESRLASQFETPIEGVTSNFSADDYRTTVQKVIDYIKAGDVFQVNLAQRLLCRANLDSVSLYLKLRERNAAPFAGYFDLGEEQIVSASPERFLRLQDGHVETRPIKGTRQRSAMPEAELFSAEALKASRKDLSENVMIVDLMRNDLSRACEDDSVVVSRLCGLETYEFVQHLVSVVEGRLRPGVTPVGLMQATFPGGSITGAPKVRAMEIIAELEPTARGAYCGSLGYIGFDGSMDLSILIRTITASRGWWQFPVGGGIVANSDPESEYQETWHKAEGMLRAIL